jgi:hypothetical protein
VVDGKPDNRSRFTLNTVEVDIAMHNTDREGSVGRALSDQREWAPKRRIGILRGRRIIEVVERRLPQRSARPMPGLDLRRSKVAVGEAGGRWRIDRPMRNRQRAGCRVPAKVRQHL